MHRAFYNPKKHDKLEASRHSHAWEQWRRKLLCAKHFQRNDELRANQTGDATGLGRRVNTNIRPPAAVAVWVWVIRLMSDSIDS